MKILHIDCSPRSAGHSRALSADIITRLREFEPDTRILRRDLGAKPVPHVDAAYATALARRTPVDPAKAGGSMRLSEELIREIDNTDAIVIGTPVNNFTVPSTLKAWIDHVVRVDRTMALGQGGKVGLLANRPVFIGIAAGGVFFGPDASQPDCITPYLIAALGCIGLTTVHILPLQATAFLDDADIASARRSLLERIDRPMLQTPRRSLSD